MTQYPLYRKMSGSEGQSRQCKTLAPLRFWGKYNSWKDELVLFTFISGTVEYTPISLIPTIRNLIPEFSSVKF